ncbi:response regulator [Leptolyngbya ohadii]|uniref:response regulator n=1 Tax=Leptolyngbya ohadii TaxID=1962290 RepID=UPI000B59C8A6|nr:response regulator [Leptolyngbya ohadii]
MQENHGDLLIVDDLADNLRVLSNTLSNQGYRVRAVKSGTMALIGASVSPPDVILLDIRMPEMDGYEVCRRLKADPKTCDIPIIFLSALDEVEDKAKAFGVGGADYITKPFQAEEVLARVKNQLTIQRLKGLVAQQKQQLEQMAEKPRIPQLDSTNGRQNSVVSAIATILDYSTRLCENPKIDPEQYAALKIIYQNGQTLLNLVNTQQEG